MSPNSPTVYDFEGLRYIPENSVLIRLSDAEKVSLRSKENLLLLALVTKPNQTVTYEELQKAVWQETSDAQMILRRLQVTKDTLQKKINNLRQTSGGEVIKSVPLEGYVFTLSVENPDIELEKNSGSKQFQFETDVQIQAESVQANSKPVLDALKETPSATKPAGISLKPILLAAMGLALFALVLFISFSPGDENEIRRVIKDSQMFESLALYQNPANFDENKIKEYWIVEPHKTDLDSAVIREGARRLVEKGIHYGHETKCEKFDFVSIDISENRDSAVAKTIESWFIAKYRNNGTLIENKIIGPYSVTYNLRKSDGKWLIEKSTTARASGG